MLITCCVSLQVPSKGISKLKIQNVIKNALTCIVIPSIVFGTTIPFLSNIAIAIDPDAIEMRRVLQQPTGAPEAPRAKTFKFENGLQYYDVREGDGPIVEEGKSVQFLWVLRRYNGYFVDASSNYDNTPFI
jgi:hypothetical protein